MNQADQRARIFISHAHADNQTIERLAEEIEGSGFLCWLDLWELDVGDSIRRRVEDGIKAADWLIVALSSASVKSAWVTQELNMAFVRELEERHVFVLPVVLERCEIPLSLRDKFYADLSQDFNAGMQRLLERFKNIPSPERQTLRKFRRHCAECDEQLPLLALLMATCMDAGLPYLQVLEILVESLPKPISEEIQILFNDIREHSELPWGPSFKRMLMRLPTRRMQLFISALLVGEYTGAICELLKKIDFGQVEAGRLL